MWFARYPLQAEESGGADPGAGGAAAVAEGGDRPASPESALSPLHWAAGLAEEVQGYSIVKEAKSLSDFVKNAYNTKTYVGKSIQVPDGYNPVKGPAEGTDLTGVLKRLGMPEKPTDYAMPSTPEEYTALVGDIPAGLSIVHNPDDEQAMRAVAHEAGLAQWQVNKLVKFHLQQQLNAKNREAGEAATARATGLARLHELHGANTPTVQANARHFYGLMGEGPFGTPELTDEIMAIIEEKHLDKDAKWVTGMANLTTQLRGGRFLGGDQPIHGAESLPDVNRQITALNDKAAANGNRLSADDEKEVDRLSALKAGYQAA